MNKRRKHADLIHAYAEGAKIEYFNTCDRHWHSTDTPSFLDDIKFRLEEEEPKPFLAWVWNYGTVTKKLRLVLKKGSDGFVYEAIGNNFPEAWEFSTPLTPEEVAKFTQCELGSVVNKRRKHADLIHAYAEGAEIEYLHPIDRRWYPIRNTSFPDDTEFRLDDRKPKTKPFLAWVWNSEDKTVMLKVVIEIRDPSFKFREFCGLEKWKFAAPLTPEEEASILTTMPV